MGEEEAEVSITAETGSSASGRLSLDLLRGLCCEVLPAVLVPATSARELLVPTALSFLWDAEAGRPLGLEEEVFEDVEDFREELLRVLRGSGRRED